MQWGHSNIPPAGYTSVTLPISYQGAYVVNITEGNNGTAYTGWQVVKENNATNLSEFGAVSPVTGYYLGFDWITIGY